MARPIYISKGKKRYVGGLVSAVDDDDNPVDVSGDTYTIALGVSNETPPDTGWVTPTVSTAVGFKRRIKLLVQTGTTFGTSTVTPGTYWCWGNVVDNPEVEALVLSGPHVLV